MTNLNINFVVPIIVFTVVIAFFVLMVTSIINRHAPSYKLGKEAIQLIEQCEVLLPRNQVCVLKAEPKE